MKVIEVSQVSKIFRTGLWKKKVAVEGLTFSVESGRVVGLLGPNGSGKSTTLKMLLGFLKPTTGTLQIHGISSHLKKAREKLGYLPENPRFQKFLKGREILHYYGSLLGMAGTNLEKRISELLERVKLSEAGNERVQGYSKGMTQRLAIAQALLHHPPLLIFDEPMSGLDPLGRIEIRNIISEIHQEMPNTTIFFSTHILHDVEQLCEDVLLLQKGRLKVQASLTTLFEKEEQLFDLTVQGLPEALAAEYRKKSILFKPIPLGAQITVKGTDALASSLKEIQTQGARILGIDSHRNNLEKALFS